MEMLYCENCKKTTGHKRAIGIGTLLGGVATLGVSLAAVPFYPLRCVICGAEHENAVSKRCPHCGRLIRNLAAICPYCSGDVRGDCQGAQIPVPPVQADTKECPFCAETIKAKAIVCRYCGRDLETTIEFMVFNYIQRYGANNKQFISNNLGIPPEEIAKGATRLFNARKITENQHKSILSEL